MKYSQISILKSNLAHTTRKKNLPGRDEKGRSIEAPSIMSHLHQNPNAH